LILGIFKDVISTAHVMQRRLEIEVSWIWRYMEAIVDFTWKDQRFKCPWTRP